MVDNKEALLKEAKLRYPMGTKIISDYAKQKGSCNPYCVIDSDSFNIRSDGVIQGKSKSKTPYVRYKNEWAKVVSYPNNCILPTELILKNVVIW